MPTEVHVQTKVLPGHRVEVADPSLPEGASVSVTVTVTVSAAKGGPTALELLDNRRAKGIYASAKHADDAVRQERESWDR